MVDRDGNLAFECTYYAGGREGSIGYERTMSGRQHRPARLCLERLGEKTPMCSGL